MNSPTDSSKRRIDLLSDRKLQVFELLGRGCSTREIAGELRVNFKTVQTFCARIKQQLDLPNAIHLWREAIRWVDGHPPR